MRRGLCPQQVESLPGGAKLCGFAPGQLDACIACVPGQCVRNTGEGEQWDAAGLWNEQFPVNVEQLLLFTSGIGRTASYRRCLLASLINSANLKREQ